MFMKGLHNILLVPNVTLPQFIKEILTDTFNTFAKKLNDNKAH